MKKRLLFLVSSIGSSGGIQKNLSMISDYLIENGYDVTILSVFKYDKVFYKFNTKIKYITCDVPKTKDIKNKIITVYKLVNKKLSQLYFDTLIVEGTGYAAVLKPKWFRKCDTIVVDHEGLKFHTPYGLSRIGAVRSVRRARAIRTLTNISKNEYLSIFPKGKAEVYTIANPVEPLVQYSNYNKESKKILYVGRLDKEKGIQHLFDSILLLKNNSDFDEDWSLDIYGKGSLEEKLKKEIEKNKLQDIIRIKGFKENIHEVYSEYAFLAVTSSFESFGLVIIEALKSGIPVVSFDSFYGPKELIDHGKNGLLVERNNSVALAKAFKSMMNSEKLRISLASNLQNSTEKFELPYIGKQWINMIEKEL